MTDDFSASLILKRGGLARVGLERIALLEAIARLGSISAAAKDTGLSYKGAWDGVQALNNLFDAPLVSAAPGGRSGGTAKVTPRGQAVIRAFRAAEREIGAAFARLEADLSGDADLLWSLGLRTSARNALRGVVTAIEGDGVTATVSLSLAEDLSLRAAITRRSVEDLGLATGRTAIALIKSSLVRVEDGDGENRLAGQLVDREASETSAEATIALPAGKTLTATLKPGDPAWPLPVGARVEARVAASDVILAVD
ncbi:MULTISPECIES: TOBE domain-containing protein [Caulobacter]|uniref:ModE molybdate transport repressor domain/molybdenum-pterin binding domain containing protein n=1 Tax=Caulobacter vibrioides OR37 TaxID=1292034 RepID=R0ELP3_CAUVI|nr:MULTISPECIES: TOBE domain-containing protein [Caulobacter]ENZ82022.1 ModE molybdate transport repressor domain/molybdenum-pterin binding domain containing protein [Caulobacter vibrioides OR37]MBQ1560963.1 TOBE domain-containing protein [Caulobacter sp.]